MKLYIKDPVMIAKIMLATSAGVILSYIILSYAYQNLTRCDLICVFDKATEKQLSENTIGRSFADLDPADEIEIKNIIRKTFENQWRYFYEGNEKILNRLYVKDLYLPQEYQRVKEGLEKELAVNYNDSGTINQYGYRNYDADDISRFINEMKFSKPRKYKNLNGRLGLMAGFNDSKSRKIDFHYFLFKKVDNQWKIEKEYIATTSPYELPAAETNIIKEILEKESEI